ncbi:MAG: HAMP domain-containing sensor histidine kinase [Myxococcota bacterium]
MPTPAPNADLLAGESLIAGRWLVALRWWAALGGLACLIVAVTYLDIDLPLPRLLAILGVVLASNLALAAAFRRAKRPPSAPLLAGILALDTALLTLVLGWSGGVHNPFSALYLVHATLAASTLTAVYTWGLVALAVLGYGSLFFWGGDAATPALANACPHCSGADGLSLHLQGMWVAFVLSAALVAHFVGRLNRALRLRTRELVDVTELAARHQRLAAMTTLAAGAAHELATPIGTIALVSRELELDATRRAADADTLADLRLIGTEAERCRAILDRMAAKTLGPSGELPVSTTLGETLQTLERSLPPELAARVRFEVTEPDLGLAIPESGLLHALRSLIDNAADASEPDGQVRVTAGKVPDPKAPARATSAIEFRVEDQGSGMSAELLARVGEPFFTTKDPGRGMGLGVFLARAFAERVSGDLRFDSAPGEGTRAVLSVPAETRP